MPLLDYAVPDPVPHPIGVVHYCLACSEPTDSPEYCKRCAMEIKELAVLKFGASSRRDHFYENLPQVTLLSPAPWRRRVFCLYAAYAVVLTVLYSEVGIAVFRWVLSLFR